MRRLLSAKSRQSSRTKLNGISIPFAGKLVDRGLYLDDILALLFQDKLLNPIVIVTFTGVQIPVRVYSQIVNIVELSGVVTLVAKPGH
jgi:hypothetical protein